MQILLNGSPLAMTPLYFSALNLSPPPKLPVVEYLDDTQQLVDDALAALTRVASPSRSKRVKDKSDPAEVRQKTKDAIAAVKQFIATREEERGVLEMQRQREFTVAHWRSIAEVCFKLRLI